MLKNIRVPWYVLKDGITHNHKSFPKRYCLWGADTETCEGDPMTLQIYDGRDTYFEWVNGDNVLDTFLGYFRKRLLYGRVNMVYFHNLQFDLSVLLYKYQKLFSGRNMLEFQYKDVTCKFCISKVWFGEIRFPDNRVLKVLDSSAFFCGWSLEKIADKLKLDDRKMKRPPDIGSLDYGKLPDTDPRKKYFIEYACTDVKVQFRLAEKILESYKKFDTRICVSLPQFAMRVFRHYYFKDNADTISFPPPEVVEGAIASYHGGKNGWYVDNPTVVNRCFELDVTSMYPYAMKHLPNFLTGEYIKVNKFDNKRQGVYKVSGTVKDCKYKCIFSHDFKPLSGKIEDIWVSSPELGEAIRSKEIKIKKIEGYVWQEGSDPGYNPFHDFVDYFYKMKDEAPTDLDRLVNKLIMNSLYGKLIQNVEDEGKGVSIVKYDDDLNIFIREKVDIKPDEESINKYDDEKKTFFFAEQKKVFRAGMMFNPVIGTLITGFSRAYLHRLEHKYHALHSSTDSIKTIDEPDPKDTVRGLGNLKVETVGKCIMLRNKLYVHYVDDKEMLKYVPDHKPGKKYKYALHGFQGKVEQLLELWEKKEKKYKVRRMLKVREGLIQGLKPLRMDTFDKELEIDFTRIDNM